MLKFSEKEGVLNFMATRMVAQRTSRLQDFFFANEGHFFLLQFLVFKVKNCRAFDTFFHENEY